MLSLHASRVAALLTAGEGEAQRIGVGARPRHVGSGEEA
jgi:hypothetical protein